MPVSASHVLALSAATIPLASAQAATASCILRGGRYDPAQNDPHTWAAAVTGGTCTINFRSRGSMVFKGTSIAARPSGGSVAMSGMTTASYQARAGFKGADSVTFKVCGEHRGGAGCSTITVNMSVQ